MPDDAVTPPPRERDPLDVADGRSPEEELQRQLSLVRAQGDAYGQALDYLAGHQAIDSAHARAGDVGISYLILPLDETTVQIGVAVRASADGRFVPGAEVLVTVIDADGREHGPRRHPLVRHPVLYQYLRAWTIPGPPRHRLRIDVTIPADSGGEPPTPPSDRGDAGHHEFESVWLGEGAPA
jgi:hypothetical protein